MRFSFENKVRFPFLHSKKDPNLLLILQIYQQPVLNNHTINLIYRKLH